MLNVLNQAYALFLSCVFALIFSTSSFAKDQSTAQEPIDVVVMLGDEEDPFLYKPNVLEFETGKHYRLILLNEGPHRHFFVSAGMAESVASEKLEVFNREGKKLVEVKANVDEIDMHGYTKVQWSFVPTKKGQFDDLFCKVPGHAEHGMRGKVIIK